MKPINAANTSAAVALAFALVTAPAVSAQQGNQSADPAHQPQTAPATASAIDVPADAEGATAVIDAFGDALAAADFDLVESMLDPEVIVLESGGAERSRSEYLGHHARADAEFLAGTHGTLVARRARVDGDTAWVASESERHASRDGEATTSLGTETMVLTRSGTDWKIVHIHWSSRPE